MPTVNPQLQKARDLMPLIAAASDEHDEIRQLTKPVVKALTDGRPRQRSHHGQCRRISDAPNKSRHHGQPLGSLVLQFRSPSHGEYICLRNR